MTPYRLYLAGIAAAVVIFLGLSAVAVLHARDERNRLAGAQMQQAVDVMRADVLKDSLAKAQKAALDSVQRVKDSIATSADGTFVDVQVKYRDRIVHDTVVKEIIAAAQADVKACKDGRAQCEVRAEASEREASRLRFVVHDRDSLLLARAQAVATPRSCTTPTVIAGVGGVILGLLVKK